MKAGDLVRAEEDKSSGDLSLAASTVSKITARKQTFYTPCMANHAIAGDFADIQICSFAQLHQSLRPPSKRAATLDGAALQCPSAGDINCYLRILPVGRRIGRSEFEQIGGGMIMYATDTGELNHFLGRTVGDKRCMPGSEISKPVM
ncbi:hypothetical protein AC579_1974 [Pseudocercospora musae]|uniref:Uncharacterized protein n=1 Tax=Pseudocercospora musae TaxID=113226 RepID=A0A139I8J2_9PEZI|nr:hypothetical protein AC579_1974 [Pseudocercospora musae]